MFESVEQKNISLRQACLERKETLLTLKRQLDAEWTFNEMGISGSPLARLDVRRMIETKNDPASRVRVLLEAHNFYRAMVFVDRSVPRSAADIGEAELLGAHAILLRGIDARTAARYRCSEDDTNEDLPDFVADAGFALAAQDIPTAMKDLFFWLNHSPTQHPIKQATEIHLRLMYTQPFWEMNGRLARLFSNLVLMQRGYPPALFTVDDRQDYAQAVRLATHDGGQALATLMSAAIERTLDFCIDVIEKSTVAADARQ